MKRLPIKFEEEVLKKHGVEWADSWAEGSIVGYIREDKDMHEYYWVSPYEIAGIALEAILNKYGCKSIELFKYTYGNKEYGVNHPRLDVCVYDKDFPESIFKVVNEVWRDKK